MWLVTTVLGRSVFFTYFKHFRNHVKNLLYSCIRTEEMEPGEIRELSWGDKAGE